MRKKEKVLRLCHPFFWTLKVEEEGGRKKSLRYLEKRCVCGGKKLPWETLPQFPPWKEGEEKWSSREVVKRLLSRKCHAIWRNIHSSSFSGVNRFVKSAEAGKKILFRIVCHHRLSPFLPSHKAWRRDLRPFFAFSPILSRRACFPGNFLTGKKWIFMAGLYCSSLFPSSTFRDLAYCPPSPSLNPPPKSRISRKYLAMLQMHLLFPWSVFGFFNTLWGEIRETGTETLSFSILHIFFFLQHHHLALFSRPTKPIKNAPSSLPPLFWWDPIPQARHISSPQK